MSTIFSTIGLLVLIIFIVVMIRALCGAATKSDSVSENTQIKNIKNEKQGNTYGNF
jgi:uncharacterized membrane protein